MKKFKVMQNGVGVVKEIDPLGRIVIPKDMRDLLNLQSEVEVVLTQRGIILRNPEYELVKKNRKDTCFDEV